MVQCIEAFGKVTNVQLVTTEREDELDRAESLNTDHGMGAYVRCDAFFFFTEFQFVSLAEIMGHT